MLARRPRAVLPHSTHYSRPTAWPDVSEADTAARGVCGGPGWRTACRLCRAARLKRTCRLATLAEFGTVYHRMRRGTKRRCLGAMSCLLALQLLIEIGLPDGTAITSGPRSGPHIDGEGATSLLPIRSK